MTEQDLPAGWRWARLGDVCQVNPRRPPINRDDERLTTFVPMTAIDDQHGIIARPQLKPFSEVKRGFTFFQENDVLFAKITPCMENGKHVIAENLLDGLGFGTTELHVIKPSENITSTWVHFFIRQPCILNLAAKQFTGSVGQQRVPATFLENLIVPLPPLEEQRRIAGIVAEQMAEVERARVSAEAQLVGAERLFATYAQAVFEDGISQGWPVVRLGDAGEIGSGVTLGPRLNKIPAKRVPYLRVANVKDGYLNLSDVYSIDATQGEIEKCTLRYGDILLTEGGDPDKLGRGTFWQDEITECLHQNHIFRVRFDLQHYSPQFLALQMGSLYGKAYFLAHAKQTTGIATINQQVLGNFPLLVPSFDEQNQIAVTLSEQAVEIENMRAAINAQLGAINELPSAFLKEAFSGQM